MEADDGKRPQLGVVVSLLDLGDGTSRIIFDDVRSDDPRRQTSWKFDCFFTHKRLNSSELDDMSLSDDEYHGLGVSLVARLLALNGRVK